MPSSLTGTLSGSRELKLRQHFTLSKASGTAFDLLPHFSFIFLQRVEKEDKYSKTAPNGTFQNVAFLLHEGLPAVSRCGGLAPFPTALFDPCSILFRSSFALCSEISEHEPKKRRNGKEAGTKRGPLRVCGSIFFKTLFFCHFNVTRMPVFS